MKRWPGSPREAHVVAAHWTKDADPYALAHADGRALGHRVTLIRPDGVVVGDADFDHEGMAQLENHSQPGRKSSRRRAARSGHRRVQVVPTS